MSHIVIHEDDAGKPQYQQFDELGAAVKFVEDQRNAGVDSVRLFQLDEVELEVTSYFRVEVAGLSEDAPASPPPPSVETSEKPQPRPETTKAKGPKKEPVKVDDPEILAPPIDDLSYVEAAMASPIEAFASEAPPLAGFSSPQPAEDSSSAPEDAGAGETRRGLFGR